MKIHSVLMLLLASLILVGCSSTENVTAPSGVTEEDAVKKIASSIMDKKESFKGKKLAVYAFSNLEGKETPECARISTKLLEALTGGGDLIFVERTEMDKLLKAQEVEQSGLVDVDTDAIGGKVLPVDVMINGTVAEIEGKGEVSVKAVSVITGQIYLVSSAAFQPKGKFSYIENPESVKLFKTAPAKLELMNKTFKALKQISKMDPIIYLLATVEMSDAPKLKKENPKLAMNLMQAKNTISTKRPNDWRKILKIRDGVALLKKYNPARFAVIAKQKEEFMMAVLKK